MVALSCRVWLSTIPGAASSSSNSTFASTGDPSRAAQILGSGEYMAHFSGANYMTRRHTVGRVEAFELRPLVETRWKPFDRRVESGVNSVPGGRRNQSQSHSGASPLSDHTASVTVITSSNVSKVWASCNIHCFRETAHGGEINKVFFSLISWKTENLDQQTTR